MEPLLLRHDQPSKTLQVDKITFGKIQKNSNSPGQFCYINYENTRGAIHVQLPPTFIPYGISSWTNDDGSKSLSVEVPLRDAPNDPNLQLILDKFTEFDEKVLDVAQKNVAEWGLKQRTRDGIRAIYKGSLIKENKDGEKKFVAKINTRRDVTVYKGTLPDLEQVDKEYVTRGSTVRMIIEIGRVWFSAGSFGVVCNLTQMLVTHQKTGLKANAFIADPSDVAPPQHQNEEEDMGHMDDF